MNSFIKGTSIYLRAISLADASEDYLQWINDAETTKGLVTGTFPSTMEDLKSYLTHVSTDSKTIMFAICQNDGDRHVGNIKLDNFDWVSRTAELGILLGAKDTWGQGIGTESCQLLLSYAFEELNLRKVSLTVYDNNPGAIRLYEKIGFQTEGRLRKHIFANDVYIDKLWMGIFKEELK
ncbi:MAG: GNAT family protein [Flavobacteriales bacterium]|nr:GNAT family protein [Flavobacteriales bacterium]MDG1780238.1 GNAT family protein [Flavobacteriales bacterium]MDG2247390.1 GNAT family protein [Flavobacteriales bacterium]